MPISQEIINLYDAFTHGHLTRRAFMERLAVLAGGTAAATMLLASLKNDYALAETVAADDQRLTTGEESFKGPDGEMRAYLARPAGEGKHPAVLVVHENRGLNPHIRDVARRIALEGFLAVAPDVLAPDGGTPANEDEARDMIGKLDGDAAVKRLVAAAEFARSHAATTGKLGVVGFCWGGGMANRLAVTLGDRLQAAIAYYGRQPAAAEVPGIKAALMLHYAGLDDRINAGIADYETALKAAGVRYDLFIYEGVQHAFNNDTNAARYDKAAADLAFGRTIDFLKRMLG
ncbi:MAG: dienelactone hydrolase family protein [Hyphomicrobiaceae bacterium]